MFVSRTIEIARRENLFQSKSASFSRMFRWLLWLEVFMYTSFYTMLEDGYKLLWSFWIKQHWTQACSHRGRLKSRWREDLFQSKSASFSRMFRWLLWLEVFMYTSFYTMLEDGYKLLWSFWIKQHWTQACSYRGRLKSRDVKTCSKANRHPSHVCFVDYYG